MKTLALVFMLCFAMCARAESFFDVEVGLGGAISRDMGDGIWIQKNGVPHSETLGTPALLLGVSVPVYRSATFDIRGRLDYVWLGQQKAACLCVSDADYAAHNYNAPRGSFNGFGHVQGFALTIEPGYTWHGYRLSAEVGPWVNWSTWHESVVESYGLQVNANHHTTPEIGYVVGAGIERGTLSLHYRYYSVRQAWNPYPGLQTGVHMLTLQKLF